MHKLPMTEKQKAARLKNLENGRKKRMDKIKQKKEQEQEEEYDIDTSEDEQASESDDDSQFIISKKKPKVPKSKPKDIQPSKKAVGDDKVKGEIDDLKNMVMQLAMLQKKQTRKANKNKKPSSTKIVVLPNNAPSGSGSSVARDNVMDAVRRSLMQ